MMRIKIWNFWFVEYIEPFRLGEVMFATNVKRVRKVGPES